VKAPKQAKNEPAKKKSVFAVYSLMLLIALAVSGGVGAVLYQSLIIDTQEAALNKRSADYAARQAEATKQYLLKVTGNVARFGQRPNVAQALIEKQQIVLDKFKLVLKRAFPDVVNIRFIPADKEERNKNPETKLLFTEMDMINRVLKNETVLPEAIKFDNKWALNIATPLTSGDAQDSAAGVIMISLSLDELRKTLLAGNSGDGSTQILQQFGSAKAVPILLAGHTELRHAGQTVAISDSHWHILFKPSNQLALSTASSPVFLIIGLSLLFVLLAAGGWPIAVAINRRQIETGDSLIKTVAAARGSSDKNKKGDMTAPMYQNQDILDVNVKEEDKDILGLTEAAQQESGAGDPEQPLQQQDDVNEVVFRAYDVRGVVGEQLSYSLAEKIGKSIGSEALDHGETWIIVARDARTHSPELCEQLINGIRSTGCNVVNIGVVPTPLMHFATHELDITSSGVMVTASHNGAEFNGFKMVINGNTLSGDAIQHVRSRIVQGDFHQGEGDEKPHNMLPEYIDKIFSDVALAGELTIVIDAANAVTATVAPLVLEELGCEVIPLHCELDGDFPNHEPDPTQRENLQDLIAKVQETEADLGVAYDGDGDRLVVVTPKGNIIWPDRLLMLFAKDIVTRHPGADVLFDVKCTRQLNSLISSYGGRPIMWKTGHAHMKSKMQETGALLGGEYSGHIFIKDRWYGFDDATYVTTRLLEIITLRDQDIDTIFEGLPELPSTPEIRVDIDETKKFDFIKKLVSTGNFENGKISTIDGLRVDFASSWGLVRASNTGPFLTLRFEGETDDNLAQVQALFKRELKRIDTSLTLDF